MPKPGPRPGTPKTEEHKRKISEALRARGLSSTKRCPKCGETKDRSEFGVRTNGYSRSRCKKCETAEWDRYRKENPAIVRATEHNRKRRFSYGVSVDDYERMAARQGGVCAICGGLNRNGRRLAIDHCHFTGLIRGLLCMGCNWAIGHMHDDPRRLQAAIDYLAKTPGPDAIYVPAKKLPALMSARDNAVISSGARRAANPKSRTRARRTRRAAPIPGQLELEIDLTVSHVGHVHPGRR